MNERPLGGLTPSTELTRRCELCSGTGRVLEPKLRIIGTDEDGVEYGASDLAPGGECPECSGRGTLPFGG